MVDHVWTQEHFCLTVSKVQPRSFAWLCTLWQRRREFYKEQTLFKSQVMKMCVTCLNRAHKSELGLFPTLNNFKTLISVSSTLTFHVLKILLSNLVWPLNKSWKQFNGGQHVKIWNQFNQVWHWKIPKPSPSLTCWHWWFGDRLSPNLWVLWPWCLNEICRVYQGEQLWQLAHVQISTRAGLKRSLKPTAPSRTTYSGKCPDGRHAPSAWRPCTSRAPHYRPRVPAC
jgi:hypothetical protein